MEHCNDRYGGTEGHRQEMDMSSKKDLWIPDRGIPLSLSHMPGAWSQRETRHLSWTWKPDMTGFNQLCSIQVKNTNRLSCLLGLWMVRVHIMSLSLWHIWIWIMLFCTPFLHFLIIYFLLLGAQAVSTVLKRCEFTSCSLLRDPWGQNTFICSVLICKEYIDTHVIRPETPLFSLPPQAPTSFLFLFYILPPSFKFRNHWASNRIEWGEKKAPLLRVSTPSWFHPIFPPPACPWFLPSSLHPLPAYSTSCWFTFIHNMQ